MDKREKQSQVCAMLQDVDVFKISEKHLPFSERYSIEAARSEPTSILDSRYIVCICQQLLQINRRIASGNRARGHSAEKIKKKKIAEKQIQRLRVGDKVIYEPIDLVDPFENGLLVR